MTAHALAISSLPTSHPTPHPAPFLAADPAVAAAVTQILADDAHDRAKPDLTRPLQVQLAPILGGLTEQGAAPADRAAALLRDLAETGLLDAGVDEVMARAHGYATAVSDLPPRWPQDTPSDAGPVRAPHHADPTAVIAALAEVCPASAAAVAVQRFAIEILAHARRTPANERLLKALRRGAVVAAVPAPGESPVAGELLPDGSVLVTSGRVRVLGAGPGAAVLLRARLGGRVVWAWTTYGAAGVATHDGLELSLDRVVLRADAVVDAAVDAAAGQALLAAAARADRAA